MQIRKICVIGLGHFGMNLAIRLSEAGAEVLAIDNNHDHIEEIKDKVALAVEASASDKSVLSSLGINDMDAVVISIGEDFEASILATAICQELGVKNIYNRVVSPIHERILKHMGVNELLLPEADAAIQLANKLMIPGLIQSYEVAGGYGVFHVETPKKFVGKSLIELDLRNNYDINIVTIKREKTKSSLLSLTETKAEEVIGVPSPDTIIEENDVLVVFASLKKLKEFSEQF